MTERWNDEEMRELGKYFKGNMTAITLFPRLKKINPSRTYEAMMTKIRHMRESGYEQLREASMKTLRVGYLDIEASNLNGDFGMILSWYIKTAGKNEYFSSVITKKEIFDYNFDKRIVEELLETFKKYDVLYTHYGADGRFDVPFIRTRAFSHGLQDRLPRNMEMFIQDTYPIAKYKLRLHNNRLDSIADAIGVTIKKTPLSPHIWALASVGHPESLEYIEIHNKRDVQILERVHQKLKSVEKPGFHSI
jgi:DNA polymerase elongation subunit (family B)